MFSINWEEDLNLWVKGLRPFAIYHALPPQYVLILASWDFGSPFILFICFHKLGVGRALSMGPSFPILSY